MAGKVRALVFFAVNIFPLVAFAQSEALELDGKNDSKVVVHGVVLDEFGEPVADAEVFLSYTVDRGSIQRLTAVSDSKGEYEFSEVPSELASVFVRTVLNGYCIAQDGWYKYYANVNSESLKTIETKLALVPREKESKSLAVVLDEAGEPLKGAILQMLQQDGPPMESIWMRAEDWRSMGLETPVSNDAGELDLSLLPMGKTYDLTIRHKGYADTPNYDKALSSSQVIPLTLERGSEVEFRVTCGFDPEAVRDAVIEISVSDDFGHQLLKVVPDEKGKATTRLRDCHASIHIRHPSLEGKPWYFYRKEKVLDFSLHRTGVIRGRVIDAKTGKGAANVGVQAVAEHRVDASATTNQDGEYEIVIADGEYTVGLAGGRNWRSEEKVEVAVLAGEISKADDIKATAEETKKGRIVDQDGNGIPGALIITDFRNSGGVTDSDGRFEIPGTTPWGGGQDWGYPVQIVHPTTRESIVLSSTELDGKETVLQREGSVVGLVTDTEGNPLEGITVGLEAMMMRGGGGVSTTLRRATSGGQGTFRFEGLSQGFRYKVKVEGQTRANFSDRQSVENAHFEVGKRAPPRRVLKLNDELIVEVRQLAENQPKFPSNFSEFIVDWGDREAPKLEESKLNLVAFPGGRLDGLKLAANIFAEQGLRLLMLVPTGESEKYELPNFQVGEIDLGQMPTGQFGTREALAVAYNSDGEQVGVIFRFDSALLEIRQLLLYGR